MGSCFCAMLVQACLCTSHHLTPALCTPLDYLLHACMCPELEEAQKHTLQLVQHKPCVQGSSVTCRIAFYLSSSGIYFECSRPISLHFFSNNVVKLNKQIWFILFHKKVQSTSQADPHEMQTVGTSLGGLRPLSHWPHALGSCRGGGLVGICQHLMKQRSEEVPAPCPPPVGEGLESGKENAVEAHSPLP